MSRSPLPPTSDGGLRSPTAIAAVGAMGVLLSAALLWFWQERFQPVEVAVGAEEPVVNGAVIAPAAAR